jgi:geranylgeranyl reductase family protein
VWDVVIVGAGPAGSAAAMSALRTRPGARVLLLDRSDFPRDKACGDGIAPQALDELARIGAAHVLADRVPVRRLKITAPDGTVASRRLPRPDYVVPRELFDARLVDAAVAAGAVLERRTVRRLEVRPDGVLLDGELAARVVVGADGANGVVRRQLGLGRQPPEATAVAVRGYAPAPPGEPAQVIVLSPRDWPAYAWSFAAGDGTANVGFGMLLPALRAKPRGGREELHEGLAELLPGVQADRLVSHHLPLSSSRPHQPSGRVLLAGDAMSLINPLTGEGIFYALLSGPAGRCRGLRPGRGAARTARPCAPSWAGTCGTRRGWRARRSAPAWWTRVSRRAPGPQGLRRPRGARPRAGPHHAPLLTGLAGELARRLRGADPGASGYSVVTRSSCSLAASFRTISAMKPSALPPMSGTLTFTSPSIV